MARSARPWRCSDQASRPSRSYPICPRASRVAFFSAIYKSVPALLTPAIIIVGTILDPLARSASLDPVHFAMIGIVSLAFGLVTPPYGLCLMVACSIAWIRMKEALGDTLLMLLPMLAVLALLIMWPQVALFVPSLISPEFLQ